MAHFLKMVELLDRPKTKHWKLIVPYDQKLIARVKHLVGAKRQAKERYWSVFATKTNAALLPRIAAD